MVKRRNPVSSDSPPDLALKGSGASKTITGMFSILGLCGMIAAPGAGKVAGFLVMATVLSTYFISAAYRVIFLPDRMRYGIFGHASVAYSEISQLRDINSWSVAYRRLIITKKNGRKIRLWNALPYSGQIVSELKSRTAMEYIDSSSTPSRHRGRDKPTPRV